jgi:peroxiredoxin Q/BCP
MVKKENNMAKKTPQKKTTKKVTKKVTKKPIKKTSKKVTKKVSKKMMTQSPIKKSSLSIGDVAPDFSLLNQDGSEVSLHDFKGKNVVVYFYPKAMTPGCTVQACEIRNSESKLKEQHIVVLGISADPVTSLKKFQEKEKLNFTLLSDPDKKIIKAYDSWGPKKFMGREFEGILRQSFLINKEGKIVHIMNKVNTKTHHEEVLDFFKNLK